MEKRNKPGKTGLIRIWYAFLYSIDGIKSAYKNEAAFRQELLLFAVLTTVALALPISTIMKLFLILCNTSIIVVELLNSAIESVVDKVSPEQSTLAKEAKDMGSSAVFLTITCAVVVWVYVLLKIFVLK
ncbi:MAG: diacylglycerol kinase [Candidatus Dadabacteria bacterium]|nr:diacylglycerol kinase [Candidatus Dadabacteria bacterium]NIS07710.1 diacylglycerol kinase [Candidatus Dadabacteria bacterium]NIV42289.1 diacylglycerol kinase [Candidatus Dadabacteria bacterium]NIX14796.1 diacylglycerol kinase [Candidatus Dadabacteria bacterium]NIY21337.1 diacylglycerol kinase [Candidatus Dadabacteria bacterium]